MRTNSVEFYFRKCFSIEMILMMSRLHIQSFMILGLSNRLCYWRADRHLDRRTFVSIIDARYFSQFLEISLEARLLATTRLLDTLE